MPTQTNQTYYFKIGQGEGSTPSEARNNAVLSVVGELARAQGVTVSGRDVLENLATTTERNYSEQTTQRSTYTIETEAFTARFEAVDEYYEKQSCWVLFEVAHNPKSAQFDPVEMSTNYKGSALWRSAIVPGWGQMYKRQTGKGVAILATQVLSVVGIVVCDNLSQNYYQKALAERNNDVRQQYQTHSDTYRNVRNGLIVAAGAVYIYNLIDAAVARGAKRYTPRRMAVLPYADQRTQGVALSFNF